MSFLVFILLVVVCCNNQVFAMEVSKKDDLNDKLTRIFASADVSGLKNLLKEIKSPKLSKLQDCYRAQKILVHKDQSDQVRPNTFLNVGGTIFTGANSLYQYLFFNNVGPVSGYEKYVCYPEKYLFIKDIPTAGVLVLSGFFSFLPHLSERCNAEKLRMSTLLYKKSRELKIAESNNDVEK